MKTQPTIVILFLVIVVIIALFASLMIPPGCFDGSRLKTFVTVFAGLSLVLTVMFYYILIGLQAVQADLLELKETQEVQKVVLDVNKQICVSRDKVPKFCAELLPLQVKKDFVTTKTPYLERVAAENELSWLVFNAFQVSVLEYKFVKEQETYYTRLFLQWTTSKILKRNWELAKISLVPKTQRFGDLLFAFAPKKDLHDPEGYIRACTAMRQTKEYKEIFC